MKKIVGLLIFSLLIAVQANTAYGEYNRLLSGWEPAETVGLEGWFIHYEDGGCEGTCSNSTDFAHTDTHSLGVNLIIPGPPPDVPYDPVGVATEFDASLYDSITAWVYLPSEFPLHVFDAKLYIIDQNWEFHAGQYQNLVAGNWVQLSITIDKNLPQPFRMAGVAIGCTSGFTGIVYVDDVIVHNSTSFNIPPVAVDDLTATTSSNPGEISLDWTAPGDDLYNGQASEYIIRYNSQNINESNWGSSIDISGEPAPGINGTDEFMTESSFAPGDIYYFALKSRDSDGELSPISNSPIAIAGGADETLIASWESTESIGLQGWYIDYTEYGSPSLFNSIDIAEDGTHSLKLELQTDGNGWKGTGVAVDFDASPYKLITACVYVPGGVTQLLGAKLYVKDANWTWHDAGHINLEAGKWTQLFAPIDASWPTPFRKFGIMVGSEDACSEPVYIDNVIVYKVDAPDLPPAKIEDFSATPGASLGEVDLNWTAPGDDFHTGTASAFVVRYNSEPIDDTNWATSIDLSGVPSPGLDGTTHSMTASLDAGSVYYFAIKTLDSQGQYSPLSNVSMSIACCGPPTNLAGWEPIESIGLQGWYIDGADFGSPSISNSSDFGHTGTHSLKVNIQTSGMPDVPEADPWDGTFLANDFAVDSYKVIETWVYVPEGVTQVLGAKLYVKDADWIWHDGGHFNLKAGEWTKIFCLIDASWPKPFRKFGIMIGSSEAYDGPVYIDDILIYKVDAPDLPPAKIEDFSAAPGASLSEADLSWTAPGDDYHSGTAAEYIIRYNTSVITEANWDEAIDVTAEPAPGVDGTAESMTITGLPGDAGVHYFALKTRDTNGQLSELSNVAFILRSEPDYGYDFDEPGSLDEIPCWDIEPGWENEAWDNVYLENNALAVDANFDTSVEATSKGYLGIFYDPPIYLANKDHHIIRVEIKFDPPAGPFDFLAAIWVYDKEGEKWYQGDWKSIGGGAGWNVLSFNLDDNMAYEPDLPAGETMPFGQIVKVGIQLYANTNYTGKIYFDNITIGGQEIADSYPQENEGIVTTCATQFMLNGQPFYFAGGNAEYLFEKSVPIEEEVLDLAEDMNLTVVRTWAFGEGESASFQPERGKFNHSAFEHLDRLIAYAGVKGIRLIMPLVDNWGHYGGMYKYMDWVYDYCEENELPLPIDPDTGQTPERGTERFHDLFFINDMAKQWYKDYVTYLLNRTNTITGVQYKDDPTIFAWEIFNEPRCKSDVSGKRIHDWIVEMSAFVKNIDSNHLVGSGEEGSYIMTKASADAFTWQDYPNNYWEYGCNWTVWDAGQGEYINWGSNGSDFLSDHKSTETTVSWQKYIGEKGEADVQSDVRAGCPNIDYCSFRTYIDYREFNLYRTDPVDQSLKWAEQHMNDALNVIGKPVIMEEFGIHTVGYIYWGGFGEIKFHRYPAYTEQDRVNIFTKYYNYIYHNDIAGSSFWNLGYDGMREQLFDDCESLEHSETSSWAIDSSSDATSISVSTDYFTQGNYSLMCDYSYTPETGKAYYDLPDLSEKWAVTADSPPETGAINRAKFMLDIYNAGDVQYAAVVVCTSADLTWHESEMQVLNSGWNTIVVDLSSETWRSAASGWTYTGEIANLDDVRKISIGLFEYSGTGSVYMDNVRIFEDDGFVIYAEDPVVSVISDHALKMAAKHGPIPNNAPVLDWTGESDYVSDGLNPETGDNTTTFTYRIKYTDVDDETPIMHTVYIDKNGDGDYSDTGEINSMTGEGTTYSSGVIYSYSTTIPYSSGSTNCKYYFRFSDGVDYATGNITEGISAETAIDAPDVDIDDAEKRPAVIYYDFNEDIESWMTEDWGYGNAILNWDASSGEPTAGALLITPTAGDGYAKYYIKDYDVVDNQDVTSTPVYQARIWVPSDASGVIVKLSVRSSFDSWALYQSPEFNLTPGVWNIVCWDISSLPLGVLADLDEWGLEVVYLDRSTWNGSIILDTITARLYPATEPMILNLTAQPDEVGKYEKLELAIDLDAPCANPYDPDEVSLEATFTSPSNASWQVYGFYMEEDTVGKWKIRFAPNELGTWDYQVKITTYGETDISATDNFTCTQSSQHGWLRVSDDDPCYLEHDDNTSFFGIGYDRCWDLDNEGVFQEMAEHGMNMLHFWLAPWDTMLVEEGLHAWTESATYYSYDQNRAAEVDAAVGYAEEYGVKLVFTIWPHDALRDYNYHKWKLGGSWAYAADKGPEPNDYINAFSNLDDPPHCQKFFYDPVYKTYQEKLYRYIIARWGYSEAVGMWALVSEMFGTHANSLNVIDYSSVTWPNELFGEDPFVHMHPTQADGNDYTDSWLAYINSYFKANDPFDHPTTASQATDEYWPGGFPTIDIPQIHTYSDLYNKITPANTVAKYTQELRGLYGKPNFMGEIGTTEWRELEPDYVRNTSFAGLAAGAPLTPMVWTTPPFSNYGDPKMGPWLDTMSDQMYNLSKFVKDIDFAHSSLVPAEVTAKLQGEPSPVLVEGFEGGLGSWQAWGSGITSIELSSQHQTQDTNCMRMNIDIPAKQSDEASACVKNLYLDWSTYYPDGVLKIDMYIPEFYDPDTNPDGFLLGINKDPRAQIGVVVERIDGELQWYDNGGEFITEGGMKKLTVGMCYTLEFNLSLIGNLTEASKIREIWIKFGDVGILRGPVYVDNICVGLNSFNAWGMRNDNFAFAWIQDRTPPDVVSNADFEILALSDGTYNLEWWNTEEGWIVSTCNVNPSGGVLLTAIPDFTKDTALKIRRIGNIGEVVNDVSVGCVSEYDWVVRGDTTKIDVLVSNQGTAAETFTLTLTDTTDSIQIGSESVTIGAGECVTVDFSWNTSAASLGSHTLRAEAGIVSGETDTADNVNTGKTKVVAQAPPWEPCERLGRWAPIFEVSEAISLEVSSDHIREGSGSFKLIYGRWFGEEKVSQAIMGFDNVLEDWSNKGALVFDLYNAGDATEVAVAIRTGSNWVWHECMPESITSGWNNSITIDLNSSDWKTEASGWEYTVPLADKNQIQQLYIIFFGYATSGSVYIDNINLEGVSVGSISGAVTIQGRSDQTEQITLELRNPGETTPLNTYQTTTAADGSYVLNNVPIGTYDLTAKSANTLRARNETITVAEGETTSNIDFYLLGGDADNNNAVSPLDASILSAAYGSSPGQPHWDNRADFDNNGVIAPLDASILSSNFGKFGVE